MTKARFTRRRQKIPNRHQPNPMKIPSLATAGLLGLLLAPTLRAEGRVLIDWSELGTGTLPKSGFGDVWFQVLNDPEAVVIDSSTDPKSPFEGGGAALLVMPKDGKGSVALPVVSYPEGSRKGWVEFQAVLEGGSIAMEVGADADSGNSTPSYSGTTFARIFLQPDASAVVAMLGTAEPVTLTPKIEARVPHTFRVAWDFDASPPLFQIQVDGQNLTAQRFNAETIPVDAHVAAGGVNRVMISNSGAALGNISGSE